MSVEALWQSYLDTRHSAVREQLIMQYAPLVKYVVGRTSVASSSILDVEDLLGFGTLGLIDAVSRFDPTRGVKFETYALQRIRGSIIDSFRKLDIVPRSARRRAREIEGAQAQLQQTLGREPDDDEVAGFLGLSRDGLSRALQEASCAILSMERPLAMLDGDDSLTLADTIEDENAAAPQSEIERSEEREALVVALQSLNERDRLVVSLYYYEELTLREISEILGVTESRVCQLHARAITRLRASMRQYNPTSAAA
ncbi:MAG: FliA/WhiG family RNA polymerase sigma factor [Chloroflexi bacterium]|nr:FliA/WhiG family RNA polymerase sigma factor [Chloroflexota bacterium]